MTSLQQLGFRWISALLMLAAASAHCHAEEQQTPATDTAPLSLGEVVVTAQKRVQSIEEVPVSMTVVDRKTLDNSRAATLTEMQQLVPNFSIAQSLGVNTVTIRGVGGGGRNIGFDTRAGVYLDGIYMGQAQALDQSLSDIEQVEVLRGPQGHLFGRNTVAGAVNITTRAPSETFASSFRAVAGNYGTREGYASVSGPISDKLLGKFSLGYEARDGFTTNLFNNRKVDDLKRASLRGQLAIQASDRLMIDLAADHANIRQKGIAEAATGMFDAPLPGGLYPDHTVNYNTTPYLNNRLSGASLTANYDMAGGRTLTAITGYRDTHQNREVDNDWSPDDMFHVNYTDNFKQLSQEIRIASPLAGPLRYVAGVYLMHESADTYRLAITGQDTHTLVNHPLVPVPIPFGTLLGMNPGDTIPVSGTVKTDSYALFGSLDYDLTDRLTLNLDARYTGERKSLLYNINGAASGAIGMGTAVSYTDGRSDSMLTPMAGITYALDKSLNLYGKYSTGFKSGGWNLDYLTATQIADGMDFNKETVNSYELGLKGATADRRLSYDLAVFHSTFKDFQVFQFVDLGAGTTEMQLKNAAKAESTGAEASLRAMLTNNLSIGGNIGILKATFNSFPGGLTGGGGDAAGKRLPDAPDLTAAVTVNYSMAAPSMGGRLDFYGEVSHRSKSYSNVDNSEILDAVSSRDIVNARVSFAADQAPLKLSLWARNLFNNNYTTARGRDFFGNQFVKRGDPRAFGIDGKISF
ncbi:MAG: TonB-dependent receptor [Gallionella sp.]|nr:TonB-dependent receptor [Gallionella sp.]